MALVLKDRVKESTTTTGTGTLTLLGAATGYQSFAAIGNGNTCYYAISSLGGGEWEVGIGTYTSSGTALSRDTILESSTGGGTIDLSAGVKDVYVVYPAEKGVWLDAAGNVVQNQFTSMNVTGTATINVATLTSGTISTAANAATDIVNKAYVDNAVAAGVHFHEPVRVESPTSLNAAYNNGTSGVGATLTNSGTNVAIQIDGVSLNVTDRVLIYTQSNATHNGVYVVSTQGAPDSPGPGAKWVLTRSDDTDTYVTDSPDGLSEGSTFFVQQGVTGAGETYTCNTPGTIVFGTTNITFAQVSSAQIYSAGTGLNLSGTTFSIDNTTVTPATYGTASQVSQIAINAQGQITSASNVTIAITASNVSGLAASATTDTTNASNITTGTLLNARTTATASNGASTIVARDTNGSFSANLGAFVSVTGNGSGLTSLNGTAISSGTVANDRTTAASANGASTIIARDASGNFTANTATLTTVTGAGSGLTSLNATALASGTVPTARISGAYTGITQVGTLTAGVWNATAITDTYLATISAAGKVSNSATTATNSNGASTIVARDASGNFSANVITANGSALTSLNGTSISTGTVANARTTAASANGASTIVARDASGNFSANTITATLSGNATNVTGTVAIANGGTGATSASTALSNLGGVSTGKSIAMSIVFGG
jgi:trimeric autotransporter adhesin